MRNVELHKELAEKHDRWVTRVHESKEEKNKVKEFPKENALNVDQADGHVQAEVKAQQVKYEELMEKEQRLDRKIKESNDNNSSLAQKVDELERRVKQLEEERQLDQNLQRLEKVELLNENQKQVKHPLKRLTSAN